MSALVVRQPIFDRDGQVYAYELVFRGGLAGALEQAYAAGDEGRAFVATVGALVGQKNVFVNITPDIAAGRTIPPLPKLPLVIEIAEHIEPDGELVSACEWLREKGHLLAIDEFSFGYKIHPLIALADFVKVDFMTTPPSERRRTAQSFARRGVKLVAENVQSHEDFIQASAMGYHCFQGFFFSKPATGRGGDIPAFKMNRLQLLRAINQPDLDFSHVEEILKRDVSLSYRLLKYINSAAFGLRATVRNIKQAVMLLGERGIKRWATVVALSDVGVDKLPELVAHSIFRAKFCESVGEEAGMAARAQDLFLMGLFSMIDAFFDRALPDILSELPIADEIKAALAGSPGAMRSVYELLLAYEQADWPTVAAIGRELGVAEEALLSAYLDALKWSRLAADAGSERVAATP